MTTPSLFDDVNPDADVRGLVRSGSPHTSVDAAAVVAPHRTELQEMVLREFERHGAMTDEQLEHKFIGFAPSTIRSRRSELSQAKALVMVGETRNSRGRKTLIWGLP
jgi:hypothetical protein